MLPKQKRAMWQVQQTFLATWAMQSIRHYHGGVLVVGKDALWSLWQARGRISMQAPGILEQSHAICSGGFYAFQKSVADVLLGSDRDRMVDPGVTE